MPVWLVYIPVMLPRFSHFSGTFKYHLNNSSKAPEETLGVVHGTVGLRQLFTFKNGRMPTAVRKKSSEGRVNMLQHPKILTNTEDSLLSMITKPVVIKQPM